MLQFSFSFFASVFVCSTISERNDCWKKCVEWSTNKYLLRYHFIRGLVSIFLLLLLLLLLFLLYFAWFAEKVLYEKIMIFLCLLILYWIWITFIIYIIETSKITEREKNGENINFKLFHFILNLCYQLFFICGKTNFSGWFLYLLLTLESLW